MVTTPEILRIAHRIEELRTRRRCLDDEEGSLLKELRKHLRGPAAALARGQREGPRVTIAQAIAGAPEHGLLPFARSTIYDSVADPDLAELLDVDTLMRQRSRMRLLVAGLLELQQRVRRIPPESSRSS